MATKLFRTKLLELLETDLVAKIKTSYGYNFTIGKFYHNDNDIDNEKSFPFIRYYLDDETRNDELSTENLECRKSVLNVFGNVKGNVQVQNTNTALLEAEKLSEDIQAYFLKASWITAGKTFLISDAKNTNSKLNDIVLREVSKPYQKSDNNFEIWLKIEFNYYIGVHY